MNKEILKLFEELMRDRLELKSQRDQLMQAADELVCMYESRKEVDTFLNGKIFRLKEALNSVQMRKDELE